MGAEREALMEHAYPAVQAFCQKHGLMFEVIDLRWAPFGDATGPGLATPQLCLEEIRRCQELSLGPNFVGLLGSHYGCLQATPTVVEGSLRSQTLPETPWASQLQTWWDLKEENANRALRPPCQAKGPPGRAEQHLMAREAERAKERRGHPGQEPQDHKSELHWEMEAGLFGSGTAGEEEGQGGGIVFFREVEEPRLPLLGKGRGGSGGANETVADSNNWCPLAELKARITSTLPPERVKVHTIPAMGPRCPRPPAKYLRSLCDQFVATTNHLILQGLRSREDALGLLRPWPCLARELAHHAALARDRARGSCWRRGLLERLCRRMRHDHCQAHPLLLVQGPPGSGKTALLCRLGEAVATRGALGEGEEAVVTFRLLGSSQESASLESLIRSLCLQAQLALGLPLPTRPERGSPALQLHALLLSASRRGGRPLVVLLDGLEKLSGPPVASWLPKVCPPQVHLVVSSSLQNEAPSWAPEGSCFEVGLLPGEDAEEALSAALASVGGTAHPARPALFRDAFSQGGRALSVAWAIQEARCRPSCIPPTAPDALSTTGGFVHQLCARLEEVHGSVLVAHALSYLACARFGLSDGELQDVLSLDNEVLSRVVFFQQSQPAPRQGVLRLPPLLWARLFRDLAPWLEEREADGFVLWGFRHREFSAAVEERYLSQPKERATRHLILADFFRGTWSSGRKRPIQLPSSSKPVSFDRKVAPQPLWFSDRCANRRKLSELPLHLLQAGQTEELRRDVLGNMNWLVSRAVSTGLGSLAADFALCLAHTSCPELRLLQDTVHLLLGASDGCAVSQIYTEMLGRLHPLAPSYPRLIGNVCRQCREWFDAWPHPVLVPLGGFLDPPEGALRKTLPAFPKGTSVLGLSVIQRRLLAGSPDGSMIVWDVEGFAARRVLSGHSAEVRYVRIFGEGSRAVSVAQDGTLCLWSLDSGTEELSVCGLRIRDEDQSCWLDVDEKNQMLYWFSGVEVTAWHLETGLPAFCIPPDPPGPWLCAGLFVPQRVVMTVSPPGTVCLWDNVSGELRAERCPAMLELEPEEMPTAGSALLQRSGRMAVGFSSKSIVMIACDGSTRLEKLPEGVHLVSPSEDESLLAAGFGRHMRIFQSGRGELCPLLDSDLVHGGAVVAAAFSTDNSTLLTSSAGDDGIWVWDLSQQGLLADVLGDVGVPTTHLAVGDCTLVSASRHAPELRVWDLSCGRKHKALPPCTASGGCTALAREGRYACVPHTQAERKVVVWDCEAEEVLQTLDASAPVRCLEVSSQKNLLFVGLMSGTVLVFPLDSGQDVGCVPPTQNPKPVTALALTQDENLLAVACEDRVRLVEVGQGPPSNGFLLGPPAYAFETHLPGVAISSLALLSGPRVLYGMTSGQIFLYHCPQDRLVPLDSECASSVTCLKTSHGEKWAFSGSVDAPLRFLWDVDQCHWEHQMLFQKADCLQQGVLCACFSKDDRFLFTASVDRCVTVWDVSQGVLLAVQSVHAKITRMEPTADGFVAATRLGYLVREKFRRPPSVSPQHDPLRGISATWRVTSRRKEEEEGPGGEPGSRGRPLLHQQSGGNTFSQACRVV